MTNPAEPSTPSGSSEKSTTKATDHELQKYDIFTRYGHDRLVTRSASDRLVNGSSVFCCNELSTLG